MSEEIIIVDKNDKVIGCKIRDDMKPEDIYRVSALWLTNSQGKILLAQRAFAKKHHPGKWGPAVAGTIAKGEDYDSNILKECAEELGLRNFSFIKGPKTFHDDKYIHFTQWYTASLDRNIEDFEIDKSEVAAIGWFSKKEIEEKLTNNPDFFLPSFNSYFKLLS